MPIFAFGLAWFGYALLALGVGTVRGCNATFSEIAWPGKYTGCNADGGGGGNVGSIPGQAPLNKTNQQTIATHNGVAGAPQIIPGKGVGPTVTTNGRGRGSGGDTKGPPTPGLG